MFHYRETYSTRAKLTSVMLALDPRTLYRKWKCRAELLGQSGSLLVQLQQQGRFLEIKNNVGVIGDANIIAGFNMVFALVRS